MGIDLGASAGQWQWLLLYLGLALVTALLPTIRTRALAGAGLGLVALGRAASHAGGAPIESNFSTINYFLIAIGVAIILVASRLGWNARVVSGPAVPQKNARLTLDWLLLVGLVTAAFAPHLILVAAGIFLALVSAAASALRSRRRPWLVLVLAGAVLLGAGFFLLFTVLGPSGGRMGDLADGPFSPPAERLLTLLLGSGSLALAGVFPFHRSPWRLALAPVAMIVSSRILAPALPEGLGDWQAPAMLWLTVAIAVASFQRRWIDVMVAGGLLGIWSGRPEGIDAGRILVVFGWLLENRLIPFQGRISTGDPRWAGVWLILPLVTVPFLLDATLAVQVLVTVVAVAAVVLGLGLEYRHRVRAV